MRMTKTVLSVLFMTTIMLTAAIAASVDFVEFAEAKTAEGVNTQKYGSKTARIVCGDVLCSDYPGGYDQFLKDKGVSAKIGAEAVEPEISEEPTVAPEEPTVAPEEEAAPTMEEKPHAMWQSASRTIQSMLDPGIGHETHQLAIILPPSDKVYKGLFSYDASEPIQLVALHGPLAPGEDNGQPIWTPDGETKFALTFIDPETSMGSWLFTGNALAVHTMNEDTFTVSYSVSYMEKEMSDTVMTGTNDSMLDPGIGHETHQLTIILPPSDKTYSGILTYAASEPIQLVTLHGPLAPGEDMGQAIWTPDV